MATILIVERFFISDLLKLSTKEARVSIWNFIIYNALNRKQNVPCDQM